MHVRLQISAELTPRRSWWALWFKRSRFQKFPNWPQFCPLFSSMGVQKSRIDTKKGRQNRFCIEPSALLQMPPRIGDTFISCSADIFLNCYNWISAIFFFFQIKCQRRYIFIQPHKSSSFTPSRRLSLTVHVFSMSK